METIFIVVALPLLLALAALRWGKDSRHNKIGKEIW